MKENTDIWDLTEDCECQVKIQIRIDNIAQYESGYEKETGEVLRVGRTVIRYKTRTMRRREVRKGLKFLKYECKKWRK